MIALDPSQLEIKVGRPADLESVLEFFDGTAYRAKPVDAITVALTPPERFAPAMGRREVQIYLRILRRVDPDIEVSLVD